jgi:CheY-like chemotaxis protein
MQGKKRVLVVDDEPSITYTLAKILEREGYETARACSGEEAIDVARSFQPDILLSDVAMGAIDGIHAAMEILDYLPGCKVLLISGHANLHGLLGKARVKGFNFENLAKPVTPSELLAKMSQILQG